MSAPCRRPLLRPTRARRLAVRAAALLASIAAMPTTAVAQAPAPAAPSTPVATRSSPPRPTLLGGGLTYVALGYTQLDASGLNRALAARGYPTVDGGAATFGAGGHVRFGRLVIGGSGHYTALQEQTRGALRAAPRGGYGLVELGWAVLSTERTTLVPTVGVGAGRLGVRLRARTGGDLEGELDSLQRSVDLSGATGLWQLGLGLDRAVWITTLSVRAGYLGAFGDTRWRADGDRITGAASAAVSGPYLRVGVATPTQGRIGAALSSFVPAVGFLLR